MTRLLSRSECAEAIRMSESWLSRGNGPRVTRIGSRVFYHPADVEAYLEACRFFPRGRGQNPDAPNTKDLLEKSDAI